VTKIKIKDILKCYTPLHDGIMERWKEQRESRSKTLNNGRRYIDGETYIIDRPWKKRKRKRRGGE